MESLGYLPGLAFLELSRPDGRKPAVRLSAGAVLLLLFAAAVPSKADIHTEITPLSLLPGLHTLEVMANVQISSAVGIVEDYIEGALDKPQAMRAFLNGNTALASLPILGSTSDGLSVWIGAGAGLASDDFRLREIRTRIETFEPEDDFYLGAGAHPLGFYASVPLPWLLSGLSVTIGGGSVNTRYDEVDFASISVCAALSYRALRGIEFHRLLSWQGLRVHGGYSFGRNSASTVVDAGVVTQDFSFDPDGAGPLFPIEIIVQIEPQVDVGITTELHAFPIALGTGVRLLDTLSVGAGGGAILARGAVVVDVQIEEEIEVLGYLSNLVAKPSSVRVNGVYDRPAPDPLHAFGFAWARYEISLLYIGVAVQFGSESTLGALATVGLGF